MTSKLPASNLVKIRRDLAALLAAEPELQFAVLTGSRATGTEHAASDWDIALQWDYHIDWLTAVARTETLRRALACLLQVEESKVDLIDLRRANLAMRAAVAEDGLPLAGEDSVSWMHFLRRAWRDLEDFYWDKQHAA